MPLDLANLEVVRLKETDEVGAFSSADTDLNNFLKVLALSYQAEDMGVTFLARLDTELVGYFTVSTANIRVRQVESRDQIESLENMEYYPALLIGRLAVEERLAGQGIGSRLLQMIYGLAVELQKRIGVRFLLMNATPKSQLWWTNRGFTPLRDQGNRRLPFLYLDIRKMET